MCTVVVLHRPGHPWPVLLAANRDERLDRPWDTPGAYWPNQPGTVAGRDRLAGGTWMAVDGSVCAAVLNRVDSLGPAPGKRSRGELPLLAVRHGSAAAAADALAGLDAGGWRTFNMVLADGAGAWFVRGLGHGRPEAWPLPPGVSVVTAHDPNDPASARAQRHHPRFAAAPVPDPGAGDWSAWAALLADRTGPRMAAINVPPVDGFGTACSSLLGIPTDGPPTWLFAPGPPDGAAFQPVPLVAPVASPAPPCYTPAQHR